MTVTHFDPYSAADEEDGAPDRAPCGTRTGERYEPTGNWSYVTCKRCLKNRALLQNRFDREEENICKQMGDQADFEQKEIDRLRGGG